MVVRVYTDGVYDLFHYGHAETLGRIRARFGNNCYLIVGVCNDADCIQYKRKPILTQEERICSVKACRYVDTVAEDAPWTIDQAFLDKYQIDVVCRDGTPYPSPDTDDVYTYVKSIGKFVHVDRTEGISTTDLLARIDARG
jgi:choline-phosphate cytidylyltransferase